jgi:hypothetical protein
VLHLVNKYEKYKYIKLYEIISLRLANNLNNIKNYRLTNMKI